MNGQGAGGVMLQGETTGTARKGHRQATPPNPLTKGHNGLQTGAPRPRQLLTTTTHDHRHLTNHLDHSINLKYLQGGRQPGSKPAGTTRGLGNVTAAMGAFQGKFPTLKAEIMGRISQDIPVTPPAFTDTPRGLLAGLSGVGTDAVDG